MMAASWFCWFCWSSISWLLTLWRYESFFSIFMRVLYVYMFPDYEVFWTYLSISIGSLHISCAMKNLTRSNNLPSPFLVFFPAFPSIFQHFYTKDAMTFAYLGPPRSQHRRWGSTGCGSACALLPGVPLDRPWSPRCSHRLVAPRENWDTIQDGPPQL